ncbi:hypothetical protein VCRA2128O309_3320002 [Vibrio crassostreae]|nr:hypothetical protein VCRA2128O309_3320002 [Vibrio crassostreae]
MKTPIEREGYLDVQTIKGGIGNERNIVKTSPQRVTVGSRYGATS